MRFTNEINDERQPGSIRPYNELQHESSADYGIFEAPIETKKDREAGMSLYSDDDSFKL
jgi:hypothetical protein